VKTISALFALGVVALATCPAEALPVVITGGSQVTVWKDATSATAGLALLERGETDAAKLTPHVACIVPFGTRADVGDRTPGSYLYWQVTILDGPKAGCRGAVRPTDFNTSTEIQSRADQHARTQAEKRAREREEARLRGEPERLRTPRPTGFADLPWGTTEEQAVRSLKGCDQKGWRTPPTRQAVATSIVCDHRIGDTLGRVELQFLPGKGLAGYRLFVGRPDANTWADAVEKRFGPGAAVSGDMVWRWPDAAALLQRACAGGACLTVRLDSLRQAEDKARSTRQENLGKGF
jgi:hypothetical protein